MTLRPVPVPMIHGLFPYQCRREHGQSNIEFLPVSIGKSCDP